MDTTRTPESEDGSLVLFPGVNLEDGERVLWEGRPGFGVPKRDVKNIWFGCVSVTTAIFGIIVCTVMMSGGGGTSAEKFAFAVVFGLFFSVVPTVSISLAIYLAKLSQASTVSLVLVVTFVPLMLLIWGLIVRELGVVGAVRGVLDHPGGPCLWIMAVPLAPALVHLGRRILVQIHTRYYLTNQRFFEVRNARVIKQGVLPTGWIQVRAIPLGNGERGHVAIGTGRRRVLLHLVDNPTLVVEEIRRELGQSGRDEPDAESAGGAPKTDGLA